MKNIIGAMTKALRDNGVKTVDASGYTLEERRATLDSAKGQIFQVTFVKKDKTIRTMNSKKWAEKAFAHGSANAAVSTLINKPEYYNAVDNDEYKKDPKRSFRAINMETMISATIGKITYNFN